MSSSHTNTPKLIAGITGGVLLLTILILVIKYPYPTAAQLGVFRTIIALAGAGFASFLPGTLHLSIAPAKGQMIRAAGGIGVFVLLYMANPASFVVQPVSSLNPSVGLAYGYYYNYIFNIVPQMEQNETFSFAKTAGGKDTVQKKLSNFRFYICIPRSPQFAQLDNVRSLSRKYIYSVYLFVPRVNRNFTMYIPRKLKDDASPVFLDIPSAVTVISEYADELIKLNPGASREAIIAEELDIFRQTLSGLLKRNALVNSHCEIKTFNPEADSSEVMRFFGQF